MSSPGGRVQLNCPPVTRANTSASVTSFVLTEISEPSIILSRMKSASATSEIENGGQTKRCQKARYKHNCQRNPTPGIHLYSVV